MTTGFFPQCTCTSDRVTKCYVHGWADVDIDKVVTAAEARGAELMKQEALSLATFLANGRPKLYVADFLIELSEKTESVTAKGQAHTQRQRDETLLEAATTQCEACALGFPTEVAEDGETYWHTELPYGETLCEAGAILALRRVDKTPDKG